MFKTHRDNNTYYVFNEKYIDDITLCFEPEYWQQKNAIIGSAQGRGTTWFIQFNALQVALRHYRRGGLFGKLVSDHYFFTGYNKARSIAELHLLKHLQTQQVNVPQPIAARVTRCGFLYQADLLSEKIPNAQDLVDLLMVTSLSKQAYQSIGQEIKKLHQAQVNHSDLNIHNILIDKDDKVWIIDFDKCYQQSGESWKEANLARLLRSFKKELIKRQIKWENKDWEVLVKAYSAE